MAERIMSRATRAASTDENPPSAKDLLENKLAQLKSFLWCLYGTPEGWFEEVGEAHLDNLLWIAADLAAEAVELFEESTKA